MAIAKKREIGIKSMAEKVIRVEILETKPSDFYIQDLDKIDVISKIKTEDLKFELSIKTSTNKDDKLIKIDLDLEAYLIENNSESNESIFGIKSATVFRTPDFDKVTDKEGKLSLPPDDDFIVKLFNISIGGIRGMLATNLLGTKLNNVVLPLVALNLIEEQK